MNSAEILYEYICSVDLVINSLDDLNEVEYEEFWALCKKTYDLYDKILSFKKELFKYGLSEDDSQIEQGMLAECISLINNIHSYNQTNSKNLLSFKKILNYPGVEKISRQLNEYELKLDDFKAGTKLLKETSSKISKYEEGLKELSFVDNSNDYIGAKENVRFFSESRITSLDTFIQELTSRRIAQANKLLDSLLASQINFAECLRLYNIYKSRFEAYLEEQTKKLIPCRELIESAKLNIDGTEYQKAIEKINYLLSLSQSFKYTTSQPNQEYAMMFPMGEFGTGEVSYRSSIGELVNSALIEKMDLQCRIDAKNLRNRELDAYIKQITSFRAFVYLSPIAGIYLYLLITSFKSWHATVLIILAGFVISVNEAKKISIRGKEIVLEKSFNNGFPISSIQVTVGIFIFQIIAGILLSVIRSLSSPSAYRDWNGMMVSSSAFSGWDFSRSAIWDFFMPFGLDGIVSYSIVSLIAVIISLLIVRSMVNKSLCRLN